MSLETFVMDKVRTVTEVNLTTGKPNWVARGVGSPSLELTGDFVEKTDNLGVLMARLPTATGAQFSCEFDTIQMKVLASQRGGSLTTTNI